jgi:hypothetical protein
MLAAVSVVGLAAAGCGSTSAAIQVGDQSMSRRDFEASLDFVYDNAEMRTFVFRQEVAADQLRADDAPPGVFTQGYVGALATTHIRYLVAQQLLRELDLIVTDEDRESIETRLADAIEGGAGALPDDLRDQYIDGEAALAVLGAQPDADEVNDAAQELADAESVSVSSRYGTWNPDDFAVDPPSGPRPAPGSGDPADGSDLPAG